MKASVAIATYNGAQYILEQLESIVNQTRIVDEVIITDDCSTDNTAEIIKKFIFDNNLSESWHFYSNEQNLGFAGNFKRAIYKCTGDVIFLCDQDDIWVKDRIEKMMSVMEENNNIGVLATKECKFRIDNEGNSQYEDIVESLSLEEIKFTLRNRYLGAPGSAMCVKRNFVDKIATQWLPEMAHDDIIWEYSLLYKCLYWFDYISMYHRMHGNNVSGKHTHSKDKRIKYLSALESRNKKLYKLSVDADCEKSQTRVYKNTYKMAEYRLQLIEKRRLFKIIPLICYLKYYYSKKSFLVEIAMALKG